MYYKCSTFYKTTTRIITIVIKIFTEVLLHFPATYTYIKSRNRLNLGLIPRDTFLKGMGRRKIFRWGTGESLAQIKKLM